MTETLRRSVDSSVAGAVVRDWLSDFENALTAPNPHAVPDRFALDCYWRDLIAFTWNIVTVEGHDGVRDMLGQVLDHVQPIGFAVEDGLGEPSEAGGVVESWIKFETAVGRGVGHVRPKDG